MLLFLVVWISINLITKVENRKCSGVNGEECCTGYTLNYITGNCEKCPLGYFDDCSRRCIKPYYGENCQSECHCADDCYCHFAHGCLKTKENTPKQESSPMHSFSQTRSAVSFLYSIWDRPATSPVQTISHDISGGVSKNNGTSGNRDADVFKHNYVLHVIIALMGVFVLFFSIYVVTYIFFKCFRKNAKDDGINEHEWQVPSKSVDSGTMQ